MKYKHKPLARKTFLRRIFASVSITAIIGIFILSIGALATSWPQHPSQENKDGKARVALSPNLEAITSETSGTKLHISGAQGMSTLSNDSSNGDGGDCAIGQEKVPLENTAGIVAGYTLGDQIVTTVGGTFVCTSSNAIDWVKGEEKWWRNTKKNIVIDDSGKLGIGTNTPIKDLHVHDGNILTSGLITAPAARIGSIDSGSMTLTGDISTEKLHAQNKLTIANQGISTSGNISANDDLGENIFNGNIGIGTLTPEKALHNAKDGKILLESSDISRLFFQNTSGAGDDFDIASGSNGLTAVYSDPGEITHPVILFDNNQKNIAIGESYGLTDLDINGNTNGKSRVLVESPNPRIEFMDTEDTHFQFRIANKLTAALSSIIHSGSIAESGSTTLAEAQYITTSGNYAYVSSSTENGVSVLDISDPANPTEVANITDVSLTNASGVFALKNYLYVTSQGSDGLVIIDISNPLTPALVGMMSDTDNPSALLTDPLEVYVQGDYAYVTSAAENGLEIIDVSDPANPVHAAAIVDDATIGLGGAYGIDISGDYAYITGSTDNSLQIIDISDPTSPRPVGDNAGASPTLSGARGVSVGNDYAIVTGYTSNSIELISIDDPSAIQTISVMNDDATKELQGAWGVEIVGNYAIISGYDDDGIEIIDFTDPYNLVSTGEFENGGATTMLNGCRDFEVVGEYAYFSCTRGSGVEVVHIPGLDSFTGALTLENDSEGSFDDIVVMDQNGQIRLGTEKRETDEVDLPQAELDIADESVSDVTNLKLQAGTSDWEMQVWNHHYGFSHQFVLRGGEEGSETTHLTIGDNNDWHNRFIIGTDDLSPPYIFHMETGDMNVDAGYGFRIDGSCVMGSCSSDARLKTNIQDIEGSLEKIMHLNPVTFDFINEKYGQGKQIGLIAQEVESVFPDLVSINSQGNKTVQYGSHITVLLLDAFQELSSEYETRLNSLEKKNIELKNRLKLLQNQ